MTLKRKWLEVALVAAVLCVGMGSQAQAQQLLMHFDMNNEGSDATMGPDTVSGRMGQCVGWVCHTWDNASLWFNGDYRYVEIANAPALNPSSITIEARVYYRGDGPWIWSSFLTKENPRVYWVGTAWGALYVNFVGASGGSYVISGPALPVNQWSTVRVTYDSTSLKLYLNGTLVGSQATGQPLRTDNTGPIYMAGNPFHGHTINSDVDDLKLWSGAVAPGSSGTPPSTPLPVELKVTGDNIWEGWLDGAYIGGDNDWPSVEQLNFSLAPGRHVLAFRAYDQGGYLGGFIATVKINGIVRHVTGDGSWKVNGSATGSWQSPQYDDLSWGTGFNCGRISAWGSAPQSLYDQGASWIWARDCWDLGESYIRLTFDIP